MKLPCGYFECQLCNEHDAKYYGEGNLEGQNLWDAEELYWVQEGYDAWICTEHIREKNLTPVGESLKVIIERLGVCLP